jgi:hypothetical protein
MKYIRQRLIAGFESSSPEARSESGIVQVTHLSISLQVFLWLFYIHTTASIQKDDIHFTSSDRIVEVTLRFAHLHGDIARHPVIDLIFTWLQIWYASDLNFPLLSWESTCPT